MITSPEGSGMPVSVFLLLSLLSLWQPIEAYSKKLCNFVRSLNINHRHFGVSNTIPLAPLTVQNCTYVYANEQEQPERTLSNNTTIVCFELIYLVCIYNACSLK